MAEVLKSRQIWFRIFVVSGIVLGLVLLVQTVATYVYVSGSLVVEGARRDAERKALSLQRSMRRVDMTDSEALSSIIEDSLADWEETVGWVRILDRSGNVLAQGGNAGGSSGILENSRNAAPGNGSVGSGGRYFEIQTTALGTVLVTAIPVRQLSLRGFGRPAGEAPEAVLGRTPAWVELAVDLNSVSASFSPLRRNLVIGVTAAFALLGMAIVIGLRFPHYLRGKQLEGQIDLARAVQGNLLPAPPPRLAHAQIAADCTPLSQIGGDFYDVFDLPGHGMGLMLGDVSGKGVSAAPLMGFIHGAAHASSWTDSAPDHERASARLNDLLHKKTALDRFVTLFWAYFEPETSLFHYVNAGHCPPMLFRSRTGGNEVVRLRQGGPVLGALPGVNYQQGVVEAGEADLLVMYSDGIVEAANPSGEEFGEARILSSVRQRFRRSVEEIRDGILADLDDFRHGTSSEDDRTLVVVRFSPLPVSSRSNDVAKSAVGMPVN